MTTLGWIVYGILAPVVFVIVMAFAEGVPLRDVWAVLRRRETRDR